MENLVGISNNVLIKWNLYHNGGNPFPVDEYDLKLFVITGRGRTEVKSFSITGEDKNIVSFQVNIPCKRFLGAGSIVLSIVREGLQIATVEHRDVFRVIYAGLQNGPCGANEFEFNSFVNVLHPEYITGTFNLIFPEFEVRDDMHLYMMADSELYNHNFSLDEETGELIYKNY